MLELSAVATLLLNASDLAIVAFVTFFVIIDPIGLLPIFIALTSGFSVKERRRIAATATVIAFGVLILFGLAGEVVLTVVGIGLPAFRISGGVMLFMIALEMLFERRTDRRSKTAQDTEATYDPSIFPLATPLMAGPGAMATVVLLSARAEDSAGQVVVFASAGAVLALCFFLFLTAGVVKKLLGRTGLKLVTRLFGVLLGALAVQFILDGLADFGFVSKVT
jgi:multiple antibiotic resistance protein